MPSSSLRLNTPPPSCAAYFHANKGKIAETRGCVTRTNISQPAPAEKRYFPDAAFMSLRPLYQPIPPGMTMPSTNTAIVNTQ